MPITFHGFGTHYYGRKNVHARPGRCAACRRAVKLTSYDTRTWFVMCYVPVIPLGRLRVLDQCPRCTGHHRLDALEWQRVREESRTKARLLVQERPDDPRAAIEAHEALTNAHLFADADAFGTAMVARFANSALVQVHVADSASAAGKSDEARSAYERAHAIDPALPGAREAVAMHAIARGEIEKAIELMNPVLAARAARTPVAGVALAEALIRAGRHAEALPILKTVLELFPTQGEEKSFVNAMRACEKTTGAERTKLARSTRSSRRLIAAAIVLLLMTVGLIYADHHAAAHRTLHVVDSAEGPLKVEVPGAGTVSFKRRGRQTLEIAEGSYVAHVSGAVERDVEFTVKAARWPRFLDDTVHVLDASGSSVLRLEHTTYTVAGNDPDSGSRLIFGRDFHELADVDYAFAEFPARLMLDSKAQRERKTRISLIEGSVEDVVYGLLGTRDARQAFELAEWRIKLEPHSEPLLHAFVDAAIATRAEGRAAAYLSPRLEEHPVDVAAHEAWQRLRQNPADLASVIERYDQLIASEPNEPAWSYLRALLSTSVTQRLELFERATRDAQLAPRAWILLASSHASAGDWNAALDSARRVLEHDRDHYAARTIALDALSALGRTEELERELDEILDRQPCHYDASRMRMELAAAVSEAESVRYLKTWEQRASRACPSDLAEARKMLRVCATWTRGDYTGVLEQCRGPRDPARDNWILAAHAEQGDMKELRAWLDRVKTVQVDPYIALGIGIACRAAGDNSQALAWERFAIESLPLVGPSADAARLLAGERRGTTDAALDLDLPPWEKSVVLALLSFSNESSRASLLDASLTLQTGRHFPRATVERLAQANLKR